MKINKQSSMFFELWFAAISCSTDYVTVTTNLKFTAVTPTLEGLGWINGVIPIKHLQVIQVYKGLVSWGVVN